MAHTGRRSSGHLVLTGVALAALAAPAAFAQEAPKKAYVSNTGDGTITVVDLETMTAIGLPIVVLNTPRGGVFHPDGTRVYIVNQHSQTLLAIDTTTDLVVAEPSIGGRPFRCGISPDGSKVYAACHTTDDVWQVTTADNAATQAIDFGNGGTQAVAVSLDGVVVCALNNASSDVRFFTAADNAPFGPTTTVGTEPHSVAVTTNGARFVVVGDGPTAIVDARTGALVTSIEPANGSHEEVRVVGNFAYATNYGDTTSPGIDVYDLRTNTLSKTIQLTGVGANGLDVSPDGTLAWVTMRETNELREVNLVTGLETGRALLVGSAPRSVTVAYLRRDVRVNEYVLPTKVKVAVRGAGQDSFKIVGTYDDGGDTLNYGSEIDVDVAAQSYDLQLTPNKKGTVHTFRDANLKLVLKPNVKGTSRGTFTMQGVRASLGTLADGSLRVAIGEDDGTATRGIVQLAAGKFKLGKVRGTVIDPPFVPSKAKVVANAAGPDSLVVNGRFDGGGVLPSALQAVRFGVGTFSRTIAGSAFVRSGDKWSYAERGPGYTITLVMDFAKETFVLKVKGVELGTSADGVTPFVLDPGLGTGTVTTTVRVAAKGTKRSY